LKWASLLTKLSSRSLTVEFLSTVMVICCFEFFFEKGGKRVIVTLIFFEEDLSGIQYSVNWCFRGVFIPKKPPYFCQDTHWRDNLPGNGDSNERFCPIPRKYISEILQRTDNKEPFSRLRVFPPHME
jgi:hypothetical protein